MTRTLDGLESAFAVLFVLVLSSPPYYGNSKTTTLLPSAKCTRPLFQGRTGCGGRPSGWHDIVTCQRLVFIIVQQVLLTLVLGYLLIKQCAHLYRFARYKRHRSDLAMSVCDEVRRRHSNDCIGFLAPGVNSRPILKCLGLISVS